MGSKVMVNQNLGCLLKILSTDCSSVLTPAGGPKSTMDTVIGLGITAASAFYPWPNRRRRPLRA